MFTSGNIEQVGALFFNVALCTSQYLYNIRPCENKSLIENETCDKTEIC